MADNMHHSSEHAEPFEFGPDDRLCDVWLHSPPRCRKHVRHGWNARDAPTRAGMPGMTPDAAAAFMTPEAMKRMQSAFF